MPQGPEGLTGRVIGHDLTLSTLTLIVGSSDVTGSDRTPYAGQRTTSDQEVWPGRGRGGSSGDLCGPGDAAGGSSDVVRCTRRSAPIRLVSTRFAAPSSSTHRTCPSLHWTPQTRALSPKASSMARPPPTWRDAPADLRPARKPLGAATVCDGRPRRHTRAGTIAVQPICGRDGQTVAWAAFGSMGRWVDGSMGRPDRVSPQRRGISVGQVS